MPNSATRKPLNYPDTLVSDKVEPRYFQDTLTLLGIYQVTYIDQVLENNYEDNEQFLSQQSLKIFTEIKFHFY